MPYILFITGCSGSGKTTLYDGLRINQKIAKTISFHDIDEEGVPPVGRGPWREFRVEQLLFNAVNNATHGTSTIICGITFPHEVMESLYFPPNIPVYFITLRTSKEKIRERLLARAQQNQDTSTFDESFNHENIETTVFENLRNQEILAGAVSALKNGLVIDTKDLGMEDVSATVANFIYGLEKEQ